MISSRLALAWFLVVGGVGCAQIPLRPAPRYTAASAKQGSAPSRMRACTAPSDCALAATDCCGDCGVPRRGHAMAVNATWLASRGGFPGCEGTMCGRCHRDPDPTLFATCRAGRCAIVDLEQHRSTRCRADDDCVLRASSCCECGATDWVAIRRGQETAYAALVCGTPATPCPACEPEVPERVIATCEAGRCAVQRAGELRRSVQ